VSRYTDLADKLDDRCAEANHRGLPCRDCDLCYAAAALRDADQTIADLKVALREYAHDGHCLRVRVAADQPVIDAADRWIDDPAAERLFAAARARRALVEPPAGS
jgi:hypothetical protein